MDPSLGDPRSRTPEQLYRVKLFLDLHHGLERDGDGETRPALSDERQNCRHVSFVVGKTTVLPNVVNGRRLLQDLQSIGFNFISKYGCKKARRFTKSNFNRKRTSFFSTVIQKIGSRLNTMGSCTRTHIVLHATVSS
jgi:hypothetical protein